MRKQIYNELNSMSTQKVPYNKKQCSRKQIKKKQEQTPHAFELLILFFLYISQ